MSDRLGNAWRFVAGVVVRPVTVTMVTVALLLFLVMDPLGNVPLFLSLLKQVPPERRRRVLAREDDS